MVRLPSNARVGGAPRPNPAHLQKLGPDRTASLSALSDFVVYGQRGHSFLKLQMLANPMPFLASEIGR